MEAKRAAVAYKGGKCVVCGYNKCLAALDFHHLDSSSKEFGIANYKRPTLSEELLRELDKCILLCRNCHSELHASVGQSVDHQLPMLNVVGSNPIARSVS